jgi:acyl-CoA synthetase (NDP forming)
MRRDSVGQLGRTFYPQSVGFYYLPLPKGKRVGIVDRQGGFAVTTCDACAGFGLNLVGLSSQIKSI